MHFIGSSLFICYFNVTRGKKISATIYVSWNCRFVWFKMKIKDVKWADSISASIAFLYCFCVGFMWNISSLHRRMKRIRNFGRLQVRNCASSCWSQVEWDFLFRYFIGRAVIAKQSLSRSVRRPHDELFASKTEQFAYILVCKAMFIFRSIYFHFIQIDIFAPLSAHSTRLPFTTFPCFSKIVSLDFSST